MGSQIEAEPAQPTTIPQVNKTGKDKKENERTKEVEENKADDKSEKEKKKSKKENEKESKNEKEKGSSVRKEKVEEIKGNKEEVRFLLKTSIQKSDFAAESIDRKEVMGR